MRQTLLSPESLVHTFGVDYRFANILINLHTICWSDTVTPSTTISVLKNILRDLENMQDLTFKSYCQSSNSYPLSTFLNGNFVVGSNIYPGKNLLRRFKEVLVDERIELESDGLDLYIEPIGELLESDTLSILSLDNTKEKIINFYKEDWSIASMTDPVYTIQLRTVLLKMVEFVSEGMISNLMLKEQIFSLKKILSLLEMENSNETI